MTRQTPGTDAGTGPPIAAIPSTPPSQPTQPTPPTPSTLSTQSAPSSRSTLSAPVDPDGRDQAKAFTGVLADFNRAEVLSAADLHVARQLGSLGGEKDQRVLLAVALTVRAVRTGSVCLDLSTVRESVLGAVGDQVVVAAATAESAAEPTAASAEPAAESTPATGADVPPIAADDELARLAVKAALDWPDPQEWIAACLASSLVADHSAAAAAVDESAGPAGAATPLRFDGGLLYLDRYWRQERQVAQELDARSSIALRPGTELEVLAAGIDRLIGGEDSSRQRIAAAMAAGRRLSVIAGGPGTGKTTTVAQLLAALAAGSPRPPRVALAAPTGKAAARLGQAVREQVERFPATDRDRLGTLSASTLHRLLGWKPGSSMRFWHDRHHRLPHDVVVVDETSMVSLTMMARLLEALRPDAHLVLVGDPDQLASVEAGAVLGDIVARAARPDSSPEPTEINTGADSSDAAAASPAPLEFLRQLVPTDVAALDTAARAEVAGGVTRLVHRFRFGGAIAELADAVRTGDADRALDLLRTPASEQGPESTVEFVAAEAVRESAALGELREQAVGAARDVAAAALAGRPEQALHAMDEHRLLCAHRSGPFGAGYWAATVSGWITEDLRSRPLPGQASEYVGRGLWVPGRPLMITENDRDLELYNGDTGVVIVDPAPDARPGSVLAAFGDPQAPTLVRPGRLGGVQQVYAMTVHKSQGSQFRAVTIILPPSASPLLTRELLYTAATRASKRVRIVGTESAVRAAISRPVLRASGLRSR